MSQYFFAGNFVIFLAGHKLCKIVVWGASGLFKNEESGQGGYGLCSVFVIWEVFQKLLRGAIEVDSSFVNGSQCAFLRVA